MHILFAVQRYEKKMTYRKKKQKKVTKNFIFRVFFTNFSRFFDILLKILII